MKSISGNKQFHVCTIDEQPCSKDPGSPSARYICRAETPCCVDTAHRNQPVLPYELLITTLDMGPMAVALFTASCYPVYWNKKFEENFGSLEGIGPKELEEQRTSRWRCVGTYLCAVRDSQKEVCGECCKLTSNGTYEWFETRTQVLEFPNSEPMYLYVATEVTRQKTAQISLKQTRDELEERVKERTAILARLNNTLEEQVARSKQQQEALAESEERFRNLFLNKHGIRFLWDAETFCIEEANIGAAEFYGYEQDGMIGQSVQRVTGMSGAAVQDRIEEVKRSGHASFTSLHRQADGEMRYVEVHFISAKNKGRRLIYSFTIDISERIEAERKVHEHKNNLKTLMNSTSDCALLVAPDGQVITMNQAARQEFRCLDQPVEDVNIFTTLHESVVGAWRRAFEAVLIMGMAEHIETDVSRCFNVAFYPVFTESLDISAVAIYAEDVTYEKRTAEHLKLLSKRVLSAQEDERKRIGRELHDSTAQTLSGIKYMLESEVACMERGEAADSANLGKMIELLQGAIVELRHIIMALRPTVLDDLGLISALRWLLSEASTIHPAISFSSMFEVSEHVFTELQKTVLFRVAQEALANAVKHSQGTEITMHVKQEGESCVLYVQDNGRGFSVDACTKSGVGLGSMRERVELAHGMLDILSAEGEGALVRAAVPLRTTGNDGAD
ncbi:PAS domain-containing sensor histidine kinase [Halodesulfovibrio spirochaetisodalis]|uniref:PAS domain-containing sensor histidine kinase n=1 Tax=Halodesulfovibrio spirochaetisodalis TaxID=1560234 RepID=UPI000829736D|nr:PAS domain-containing sensor histidine kinase [Halodesulfovibrio spirochaetisodalis]